jgi:protein SCO1/2
VHLGDFRGRVIVLTDFLTLCREVCPLTSANFAQLQRELESAGLHEKVELVELTVDPARDTPARLRAYGRLVGAKGNWQLLTGRAGDLARLWRHLGVGYSVEALHGERDIDWWTRKPLTYDVQHTDAVFVIDGRGRERYVLTGNPDVHGVGSVPLRDFLNAEGRRNLGRHGPAAWTVAEALAATRWVIGAAPE